MAKQIEKTIESFRGGLNCAQAVVSHYADELEFDKDLGISISCGFGAGMGKLQGTCGAVTGSYMILGIYNCKKHGNNTERKAATYDMVRRFNEKFLKKNGATDCLSLLNCEIKTDVGHKNAKEKNLFVTVCEKCITDSIAIVDDMIVKQS
jgi:C_GCAxxG_C_C family probable redox protein